MCVGDCVACGGDYVKTVVAGVAVTGRGTESGSGNEFGEIGV